jgi:hypothetical protein
MAELFEREYEAFQAFSVSLSERLLPEGVFRARLDEILNLLKQVGLVGHVDVRVEREGTTSLAQYGTALDHSPWQSSSSKGQTGAVEAIAQWWIEGQ